MAGDSTSRVEVPDFLIIGQVVAPFGVRGELKVNVITEFPERFDKLDKVVLAPFAFIAPGNAPSAALNPRTVRLPRFSQTGSGSPRSASAPRVPTPFEIEDTRFHKGQLLLKLQGVDDASAAEVLRGCWLLVPREEAKKLPRGAHYIYEVVGLDVYTTGKEYVGKIMDVLNGAANDVYVVRGPGVAEHGGELLVPAVKAVVKRMEIKRGRVVIAPLSEWM